MKASKLFFWVDLIKPAVDCEEPGFGVYVLGPTNFNPESLTDEEFLLCWDQGRRPVKARPPNVIDPFGPIFNPDLLTRAWQAPRQGVFALNVERSFAEDLSSSRIRYLSSVPMRLVSFLAYLEWNEDAFINKHELPKEPYQNEPRYRAIAERLQSKGICERVTPDLRRDAIGIPVSISLHSKETHADGIMMLQSEKPSIGHIRLFLHNGADRAVIEAGTVIQYRGKIVASILRLEGSVALDGD
jgi:hypothetical protein